MTEDTENPKPRRRKKKRVFDRRIMIYMHEGLLRDLVRVADETGVPLTEVGRRALRAGLRTAERDLKKLHGREDTSSA